MKLLYVFSFLFLSLMADSQKLLRGIVLDEAKKPITRAIVFLDGTTIGTSTNEQGEFALKIPNGKHNLVAGLSGFQTHNEIINSNELQKFTTIHLKSKSAAYQKNTEFNENNDREKWEYLFIMNFIGTINGQYCRIKNFKAIHFQVSDETGELSVFADEPLIIQNKALGYTIQYLLESFNCNFKTQSLSYAGYSFFVPMNGNAGKQRSWEKKRSQAYFGSKMHFMRSVYGNQIIEEDFDVRALRKVRNIPAYQRNQPDSIRSHFVNSKDTMQPIIIESADNYEDQILNADNYRNVIGATLVGDRIAFAVDRTTAGLYFDNFLLVTYRGKEYQLVAGTSMTSELVLINKRQIEIEADGSYYDTGDLLVTGYWALAQKIVNILPFDYDPPEPK